MLKSKIFSIILFIPILLSLVSSETIGQNINHFEVSFSIKNRVDRHSWVTTLTDKHIIISEGVSNLTEDTFVLFKKILQSSGTLRQIGEINPSKLKKYYSNLCVDDGFRLSITIKKDGIEKLVHISNYYPNEVAKIIYLINSHVPEIYKISYYSEKLVIENNPCIISHN